MLSMLGTEASSLSLASFFRSADETHWQQGQMLDRLGFGPQETPSRTVRAWRSAHLVAYQAPASGKPAILIVPAPIKSAYIWDLAPGASAVERCLAGGLQVYLVAWHRPQSGDEWMGLAEYADRAIEECLDAIAAETNESAAFLAGHSLGGTIAAIFTSLHSNRVRGLIALEAPIEFGAGRLEAAIATGPPAAAITSALGNVPGTFLDWTSIYADPITFTTEPWLDWLESSQSAANNRRHWQVRRWALDESPIAQRFFEEVWNDLYRENRFAAGALHVGGRHAEPRAITVPILAVVDPRSRLVPPPAVEAYRTRTSSSDVQVLQYLGDTGVVIQHVGVLVGAHAHQSLWPRILAWLQQRAAS
jgi:polyhydroxyalkanoate synthase